jgi:hypothetical protein
LAGRRKPLFANSLLLSFRITAQLTSKTAPFLFTVSIRDYAGISRSRSEIRTAGAWHLSILQPISNGNTGLALRQ